MIWESIDSYQTRERYKKTMGSEVARCGSTTTTNSQQIDSSRCRIPFPAYALPAQLNAPPYSPTESQKNSSKEHRTRLSRLASPQQKQLDPPPVRLRPAPT